MNILILGTAYPLRGGIAHYNALLYTHLKKKHTRRTHFIQETVSENVFSGENAGRERRPGLAGDERALIDSVNPFNWIWVGLMLRKRNADLVIFKYWLPFFGPCFGTICALLKYGRKTQVVAICDNVIPHEHSPGDRLFTYYAFKFVDAFIVQSDSVEKDLLSTVDYPRYKKIPHPVYEIFGNAFRRKIARDR